MAQKKYRGRDRVVFLEGYAAGWEERGNLSQVQAIEMARMMLRTKPLIVDPPATYRAVDGQVKYFDPAGIIIGREDSDVARYTDGPRTASETLKIKPFKTRQPTPEELAILGKRKRCDGEDCCPVQPGCHICGLTREELATLDKARGR